MTIISSLYFKRSVALLLIACLVPMLVLGFTFINLFGSSIRRMMTESAQIQVRQIGNRIDELLSRAIDLSQTCANQMIVKSVLSYLPGQVEMTNMQDTLKLLTLNRSATLAIHVVGRTHAFSSARIPSQYNFDAFSKTALYTTLDSTPRSSVVFSEPYVDEQWRRIVLSVIVPIFDYHNNFVGYAIVDIYENAFRDLLSSSGEDMHLALWLDKQMLFDTSPNGIPTYESVKSMTEHQTVGTSSGVAEREEKAYFWNSGSYNRLIRVFEMDTSDAGRIRGRATSLLALLIGLSVVLAAAIAFVLSLHQSKPIVRLHRAMDAVGQGDLTATVEIIGNNELADLGKRFNHLVRQLNDSVTATAVREAELRRQEITALQAQINPHFIYNSMGAARSLIRMGFPEKASEIISHLSTLLHANFQSIDAMVPLGEDILLIRSYMVIQNIRFNGRFALHVSIPENIMSLLIPSLILQPIVENAVKHGLETKTGSGDVWVTGWVEGEALILTVEDNGVGISPELEEKLNADKPVSGHIGFQNVRRRIELYFGADYTAHICGLSQGTRVTLRLRINRESLPCIEF